MDLWHELWNAWTPQDVKSQIKDAKGKNHKATWLVIWAHVRKINYSVNGIECNLNVKDIGELEAGQR